MPNYPRELNLGEEVEGRLRSYLDDILTAHDAERQGHLSDIMGWQKDYWAKPSAESNSYPFQGACNLVIPITAINVEAIHARAMTTLNALPEIVAAKIKRPDLQAAERPLEQMLDADLKKRVKFTDAIEPPIQEIIKLGTGVGYSYYEKVTRQAVREIDGEEQKFEVTVREGARITGVPLPRFLFPFTSTNLEDAPWLGEEHTASPYEVRLMEDSGLFRKGTMDKLGSWISTHGADPSGGIQAERQQQDLENTRPVWPRELHWEEIWLAFDVDNDMKDEEIVVHYHRQSQTFMSIRYNWHEDLRRKYRVGKYIPVEYRIPGIGVGKQTEQFMEEITTQHRQMIDAGTLANAPMLKISKLSGYGPGEPIYPGKMWFLDDMTQMDVVQLRDIYQSAYANESSTMTLMQQRTGIHDVTLGMPQSGTPGTATDTLARVKEGSLKVDYTYANIKKFADELILDYFCDMAQFGARYIDVYATPQQASIQKVLSLPISEIRSGMVIDIATSGQKDNKLQDRQDWQTLTPQLTQYISGLIQLAQLAGRQDLIQAIAMHGFTAANEAMTQILQTFDVRNLDRILFNPEVLANGPVQSIPGSGIPPGGSQGGFNSNGQGAGISGIAALLGGGPGNGL